MSNIVSFNDKYEKYITFDEPIPYWSHNIKDEDRNGGNCLLFYPIMIRDMFEFYRYCGCLLTDHSSVLDKGLPFDEAMKVLSMTCYEYLWWSTFKKNNSEDFYIYQFSLLLSLCLRDNYFKDILDNNNWEYFLYMFEKYDSLGKPGFVINDIIYDSTDFDEIKQIISLQNSLELPDVTTDIKFRQMIEEQKRLLQRLNGTTFNYPTLEEEIICLSISTSMSINEIQKMSMRKFMKTLKYADKRLHYQIYLTASLSGMVEFKEKIEYWMSSLENEDRYKGVLMKVGEFEDKVENVT